MHNNSKRPEPTPEEIVEACREIRAGWSEHKWSQQEQRVEWEVPLQRDPVMKSRDVS